MILVLLGTNPYPFNRLLHAVEAYARQTGSRVIVQSGNTPVTEGVLECHAFVNHSQIIQWLEESEVVIAQGGFGSLRDCIVHGVPVVAVPRQMAFGESMDDQEELVRALADEELVVPVYDITELPDAIQLAKNREWSSPMMSELPDHVANTVQLMLSEG